MKIGQKKKMRTARLNVLWLKLFYFGFQAGIADMVASAEAITQDSEKYVEQLLQLFRRFSLLVNQVGRWRSYFYMRYLRTQYVFAHNPFLKLLVLSQVFVVDATENFFSLKNFVLHHFLDTYYKKYLEFSRLFKVLKNIFKYFLKMDSV